MHGHLNEGQTFTEKALSASEGILVSEQARAKALIAAGTLASIQNDYDRTEAYCRESLLLFRELEDQQGIALSLYLLSVVPMMKGNNVAARSLTEEALALFRAMGDQEHVAWSLSTLGLLDTHEEKYASARARYVESLGEQNFAAAWEAGRAMTPEQAITSQGSEIGAPMAALATSSSSTHPAESTYPAGLTAREVEVLRLVTRGLTSGEIALELKISEKTVAHHLTHIFNKTSSENRAAAAAFAIRHGLA